MTATDPPIGTADYLRLLDPAVRADPYPLYARLRQAGALRLGSAPVVVLSSYADCTAMLRDARASVDRTLATLPMSRMPVQDLIPVQAAARHGQPSFLFLDPPDHTRLRRLVSKAFTSRVVQRLQPRIAALVDDALDRAAAAGSLDVVADVAYPLPVTVICELLGVPLEDEASLRRWSALMARTLDPTSRSTASLQVDPGQLLQASTELYRYFDHLTRLRRAAPGADLLSALIAAQDAGDELTHEELISTCALLLIAGHETTVNLIANAALALLRHPTELTALRTDPDYAGGVVEETLRYDPPVQLVPRIAREDMHLGGVRIERGDLVMLLLAAAHRDPAAFAEPDRFEPRREARHLAFGMGTHFCLGAPLARLEARLALTRFAQRVRGMHLVTDPPPYREHVTLRGPSALPVAFDKIAPRSTPW